MINYSEILNLDPYSKNKKEKGEWISQILRELTKHHEKNCPEYRKILTAMGLYPSATQPPFSGERLSSAENISYEEIPFIPVRMFKEYELRSIAKEEIFKTLTSSGTTGQAVSKIYLDKQASSIQTKVLTKIVGEFVGKGRHPMIILDSKEVIKNRQMFSARGAGIIGFSIFGRDKFFAFDEEMKLDVEGMEKFLEKYKGEKIFLFGFTFMIWQHFYEILKKNGYRPDLSKGILIHGGGWKKLADKAVSPKEFNERLKEVCAIESVHEYYGMVEQTGTIYVECEKGHLHCSIFSDVCIRDPITFSVLGEGEKGLIEVVSVLPYSYPGHVLLTEDEGMLLGEDNCECGRLGKYFKIMGRIKNAEIRGCSDTYEKK
ncbi:MAG: acyl-protein synthetase [Candidatus Epulonipiscioides saccharophilum]|nr:MAG: acyl-protein synthetase [Epulopiscium sp. AS2M-Bin001]